MKKIFKKFGFTLAEVLIAIGIIGTIAAMTIPTLKDAYEEHLFETRAKAAYNHIQQAVSLSKFSGDRYYGEYPDVFYKRYVKNNLKITRECIFPNTGCKLNEKVDSNMVYVPLNLDESNIGLLGNDPSTVITDSNEYFIFANKSKVQIQDDYKVNLPEQIGHNGIVVYFDSNGQNEPNMLGYDGYVLVWNGVELVPAGYDATTKEITDNCSLDKETKYDRGVFCLQYMIDNGWKINRDLF